MADRGSGEVSLATAGSALGARLAAAAGALAALISLLRHAPVHVASLRGAVAFLVVLATARLGLRALERAAGADAREGEGESREPDR